MVARRLFNSSEGLTFPRGVCGQAWLRCRIFWTTSDRTSRSDGGDSDCADEPGASGLPPETRPDEAPRQAVVLWAKSPRTGWRCDVVPRPACCCQPVQEHSQAVLHIAVIAELVGSQFARIDGRSVAWRSLGLLGSEITLREIKPARPSPYAHDHRSVSTSACHNTGRADFGKYNGWRGWPALV